MDYDPHGLVSTREGGSPHFSVSVVSALAPLSREIRQQLCQTTGQGVAAKISQYFLP